MTYGLWLSAAGLQGNQYRQAVMANNMANVDTVGFKKDLAVMRERPVESLSARGSLYQSGLLKEMSGGTHVSPTHHSFVQGPAIQTGSPLDLAVDGEGFFAVKFDGEIRYTRDGRFTTNDRNELIMVANDGRARVLDDQGLPIDLLPGQHGNPEIAEDGTVRQGGATVGKIGLFDFADRGSLRKSGGNLFVETSGEARPAKQSSIRSGVLEGSTVDPVDGLATLIEVSRAYQLNAQMISLQDTTIGQAVGRLGRIG